ncbi:helix-turn-helix domain-containing protein [Patescibacteria group bacterium]|nr:helix-turn-helix transcriptional regulator [Candidatus Falkowbacteria bacterium]MBU3906412.1 helix-turn-helix domain-containing protein [Patescibacteria group bacterium]MCG2698448.1 helix-turn-helix domain-containing protein [Candidatus Parcubacteria bacterium]MBU4014881.1 helix-turn-helix domain-containing protein [Patescibacteria group bacterium]MBU4026842.1 helix-turn-helix domain-containing protein [Patescibacteria group bacterium]
MPKTIYTKEYRNVIEKLKNARSETGFKQEEVAKKLSKPQSYVSKSESGERRLDITELKKFADIYKKQINYFIK